MKVISNVSCTCLNLNKKIKKKLKFMNERIEEIIAFNFCINILGLATQKKSWVFIFVHLSLNKPFLFVF